jgi:hypothetical protein
MVADGGYTGRANIIELERSGVDFIGSLGDGGSRSASQFKRRGVDFAFRPEAFNYDANDNTYTCPGGKNLQYAGKEKQEGYTNYKYLADTADCQACSFKEKCCPQNAKGRSIVRSVDAPAVVSFKEKMQTEEAKKIYKKRGAVAEFSNAWIKTKIGLRQFRLRGMVKVGIETIWACLTYNIQQWIRLRWKVQWVTELGL